MPGWPLVCGQRLCCFPPAKTERRPGGTIDANDVAAGKTGVHPVAPGVSAAEMGAGDHVR